MFCSYVLWNCKPGYVLSLFLNFLNKSKAFVLMKLFLLRIDLSMSDLQINTNTHMAIDKWVKRWVNSKSHNTKCFFLQYVKIV